MRVLIVEDDREMAQVLQKGLQEENHSASIAADGREALALAQLYDFDVVLLDIMLPAVNGFEVARKLRAKGYQVPIVMLTARDTTPDIIKGLDLGADDYLTKPFSFEVLLARLRTAARHRPVSRSAELRLADLVVDPAAHRVWRGGKEILLSPTEFRLLEFLMRRSGRIASRNAIVEGVWGFDEDIEPNTLDAFIRLLRNKVDRDFSRKLIHTVRTVGYCVREDPVV